MGSDSNCGAANARYGSTLTPFILPAFVELQASGHATVISAPPRSSGGRPPLATPGGNASLTRCALAAQCGAPLRRRYLCLPDVDMLTGSG
jgi:hypothetical protein